MRKICLLWLLAWGLAGCTESPKPGASQLAPRQPATLRGYYTAGDGVNMFRNCGDNKQYWVQDATGSMDSLYEQACFPAPIPFEAVYAVLTGTLGPKDSVGAASEADGTFTVNRVDTLQAKSMFTACIPYEFWCHGTEPFWSLQISEAEGGIFFKNMADETGTQFTWTEPRSEGASTWVYETNDTDRPLKIVIKKGKCSDGMSDIEYNYSAELSTGGVTLHGCAVRGGEPIPRPNN